MDGAWCRSGVRHMSYSLCNSHHILCSNQLWASQGALPNVWSFSSLITESGKEKCSSETCTDVRKQMLILDNIPQDNSES